MKYSVVSALVRVHLQAALIVIFLLSLVAFLIPWMSAFEQGDLNFDYEELLAELRWTELIRQQAFMYLFFVILYGSIMSLRTRHPVVFLLANTLIVCTAIVGLGFATGMFNQAETTKPLLVCAGVAIFTVFFHVIMWVSMRLGGELPSREQG